MSPVGSTNENGKTVRGENTSQRVSAREKKRSRLLLKKTSYAKFQKKPFNVRDENQWKRTAQDGGKVQIPKKKKKRGPRAHYITTSNGRRKGYGKAWTKRN